MSFRGTEGLDNSAVSVVRADKASECDRAVDSGMRAQAQTLATALLEPIRFV